VAEQWMATIFCGRIEQMVPGIAWV
jgi:hypothetical protein